jgi:hypothetical protein
MRNSLKITIILLLSCLISGCAINRVRTFEDHSSSTSRKGCVEFFSVGCLPLAVIEPSSDNPIKFSAKDSRYKRVKYSNKSIEISASDSSYGRIVQSGFKNFQNVRICLDQGSYSFACDPKGFKHMFDFKKPEVTVNVISGKLIPVLIRPDKLTKYYETKENNQLEFHAVRQKGLFILVGDPLPLTEDVESNEGFDNKINFAQTISRNRDVYYEANTKYIKSPQGDLNAKMIVPIKSWCYESSSALLYGGRITVKSAFAHWDKESASHIGSRLDFSSSPNTTLGPEIKLFQEEKTGKWCATDGVLGIEENKLMVFEGLSISIIGGADNPIIVAGVPLSNTNIVIQDGKPLLLETSIESGDRQTIQPADLSVR